MDKVWIVMRSTGEWSDRQELTVRAFHTEEAARNAVETYSQDARLKQVGHDAAMDRYRELVEEGAPEDVREAAYPEYFDEPRYFICEVPFNE